MKDSPTTPDPPEPSVIDDQLGVFLRLLCRDLMEARRYLGRGKGGGVRPSESEELRIGRK